MTEEEINAYLLAYANGRPLRDILAEVFLAGNDFGWDDAHRHVVTARRSEDDD